MSPPRLVVSVSFVPQGTCVYLLRHTRVQMPWVGRAALNQAGKVMSSCPGLGLVGTGKRTLINYLEFCRYRLCVR